MSIRLSCKNLEKQISLRKTKKNKYFRFLGEGTYGKVFKGTLDKKPIAIKFVKMKKKYKNDNTHPANIEANIGFYFSIFSKKQNNIITPHIIKTVKALNCNRKELGELNTFKKNSWYNEIITNAKLYNNVKIIMTQYLNFNLSNLFKKKIPNEQLSIIFFQICYTLVCIQNNLEEFRHNDLKPSNIFYTYEKNKEKYHDVYLIMGIKFYIPCLPFTIKIADFDFCNSKLFKNQKVHTFKDTTFYKKGITPEINPVYDIHYFINTSLSFIKNEKNRKYLLKFISLDTLGKTNKYTNSFRLTSYHIDNKYNYIPKDMLSPAQIILKHFNKFKNKPSKLLVRNFYNSNIYLNNIKERKDMFNII